MIIIKEPNKYYFPIDYRSEGSDFLLILRSDLTKNTYEYTFPNAKLGDFYTITITQDFIDGLKNGEYEYRINHDDIILSRGIIRIGELPKGCVNYDNIPNYVVYDPNLG